MKTFWSVGAQFAKVLALACIGLLAVGSQARAQDEAQVRAGLEVWRTSGCSNCHGLYANGENEAQFPAGSNLRKSTLTRDQLVETVRCGRPGTGMPYHDPKAYAANPCYGLPLGPPPKVSAGAPLSAVELESLATYLMTKVVGRGPVTKDDCAFVWGDVNHPLCRLIR